ncbi:MAG: glycosyl transferase, partial [Pedococcus sp.]
GPSAARAGGGGGAAGGAAGGLLDASVPTTEVVSALSADASSYRWVAAAVGSQSAAGLQLGTGLPVMAIGGFNGSDPSPTLAQFQAYVAAGDVHYLAASDAQGGGRGGGPGGSSTGTGSQITTWVAANYSSFTIGGSTFYDLTQPLSGATSTGTAGATTTTTTTTTTT